MYTYINAHKHETAIMCFADEIFQEYLTRKGRHSIHEVKQLVHHFNFFHWDI